MIRQRFLVTTLAGALSLSACSISSPEKANNEQSADSNSSTAISDSSSASPSTSFTEDESKQQARDIGLDPDNLPKPLATETLMVDPAKNQTADLALHKLEKRGKVMLAYFSVTPHNLTGDTAADALKTDYVAPKFLDLDHLKRYNPAKTGFFEVETRLLSTKAASDKRSFYFVAFPQLPPSAKNVYLQFTSTSSQHHKVATP